MEPIDNLIRAQQLYKHTDKRGAAKNIAKAFEGEPNSIIENNIDTIMDPDKFAYKLILTALARHRNRAKK